MIEKWVDIVGYENLYSVSSHGRVMAKEKLVDRVVYGKVSTYKRKSRIMKQSVSTAGYLYVQLSNSKKVEMKTIHRLLSIHFIANPTNRPCVNHIDGVKTNNSLSNLEWCTYSENSIHIFKIGIRKSTNCNFSKINYNIAAKIRELSLSGILNKELAKMFSLSERNIWAIVNKRTWKYKE